DMALAALRSIPRGKLEAMQDAIVQAQSAFAQGRYAEQAEAFNGALAVHGVPPIALRSPGEPLTAANVVAAPARRDAGGPLVAVLMTTFNSMATIGWSVASVLAQSHGNLELIVVDDASGDGTCAALAEIARGDPRLRLERMPAN